MKKVSFIPSLTPLRGVAAMLVVYFHYNIFLGRLAPEGIMVIDKMYLMVDLFFVLSGFIMYHVYGSWFAEKIQRIDFMNYMKARFARLYPLHIVLLVYLVIMSLILRMNVDFNTLPNAYQNVLDPWAIPTSALLIQGWGFHLEAPWNTAAWSISVEWFLYLLFPFLIAFMVKYKKKARWVLGLVATIGFLVIMFYIQPIWAKMWAVAREIPADAVGVQPTNTIDLITGPALLRGFCGFIFGMISYELYQQNWGKPILQQGFWFVGIWIMMLLLWVGDWLPDVVAVILFALLILHSAYVEGLTKRILNNRVFTYLGDISYSIYMVHIPLILTIYIVGMIAAGGMPEPPGDVENITPEPNYLMNWVGATIFLLITIGIASLTYRFIEMPFRKKLKRWLVKKEKVEIQSSVSVT